MEEPRPTAAQGPLAGLKVLEASCFISGPLCAQTLADMGAEVIKIEKPGSGDPFRSFAGSASKAARMSAHFYAVNRNKRSVELDIGSPEGKEAFLALAADADVIVENFRPGVMARLGLGYDDVRAIAPGLVYCSITGFGQTGPYAHRPAYDAVGLGMSGLASMLLDPADPRLVGPNLSDGITALTAAYSVLAAVRHRDQTGQGQHVDVPMLTSTTSIMQTDWATYFSGTAEITPRTRASRSQTFSCTCSDGRILIVHLSFPTKFWEALLGAIEHPELGTDPRFAVRDSRMENFEVLQDTLSEIFVTRPRAEWMQRLEAHDVPYAPAYTLPEVLEDPQVQSMDFAVPIENSDGTTGRGIAPPMRFSETPWGPMRGAPSLGRDTDEVLGSGWSS